MGKSSVVSCSVVALLFIPGIIDFTGFTRPLRAQTPAAQFPERPAGPSQPTPPSLSGDEQTSPVPESSMPAPKDSTPSDSFGDPPPATAPAVNSPPTTVRQRPRQSPPPESSGAPVLTPPVENSIPAMELPSRSVPTIDPPIQEQRPQSPTSPPSQIPTEKRVPAYVPGELTPDEIVNIHVYETGNRGVVNITSKGMSGERFLFMEIQSDGAGSGTVIDRQGHLLTNYHVIEKASQVEVGLYDGSTYPAKYVGGDPINDLAVIKIDAPEEKLFPIEIGDSSRLKVGMRVFAIGNPFGMERTMTAGIVSSLNRTLQISNNRTIKALIQTDAAVNPGNSGGPLLNTRGELIGVNTAIATSANQSAGVALAIPASLVQRVVPQLIQHGRVIRPEIGIQQVLETESGLRIAALTPGGPAERAGLRGPRITRGPLAFETRDRMAADVILSVDGESVKTADDFLGVVERKKPGESVVLSIQRGDQVMEVPVTLAGGPVNTSPPTPPVQTPVMQPYGPMNGPFSPPNRQVPMLEPVPQR